MPQPLQYSIIIISTHLTQLNSARKSAPSAFPRDLDKRKRMDSNKNIEREKQLIKPIICNSGNYKGIAQESISHFITQGDRQHHSIPIRDILPKPQTQLIDEPTPILRYHDDQYTNINRSEALYSLLTALTSIFPIYPYASQSPVSGCSAYHGCPVRVICSLVLMRWQIQTTVPPHKLLKIPPNNR